jgi:hypothetical protein
MNPNITSDPVTSIHSIVIINYILMNTEKLTKDGSSVEIICNLNYQIKSARTILHDIHMFQANARKNIS